MAVTNRIIIKIGKGDDAKEYPLDLDRVLSSEAIAAERVTGVTWPEVCRGLGQPVAVTSVTAILWIARKRQEPRLGFQDVQFAIGDLELIDPDDLEDDAPEAIELPKEEPSPASPSSDPGTGSL